MCQEHDVRQCGIILRVDDLFVYGPDGDIISVTRTTVPARLIFTPQGTVFGCPVVRPDGTYAHREFSLERGTFTFRRVLRLPVDTIWGAAGCDGQFYTTSATSDAYTICGWTWPVPD